MKNRLFRKTILTAVLGFFICGVSYAQAAEVLINPPLIDEEMITRDVITKDITLANQTDHKLVLFATVNEIAIDEGGAIKEFVTPVMTDRTNTITSWIEVTRGRIEIDPGASMTIPLTVRINPNAQPGIYHALIGFVPAPNRPEAEARAMRGDADGTILKVTLQEKRNELLRISNFLIDRFIFLSDHRDITIEVQNNGDSESVPTGEIIFYNSRGEEIASARVNQQNDTIAAGETKAFKAEIPFYDKLGRFKANVKMDYGTPQKVSIFDTAQFFMIPFKIMILLGIAIVGFSLLVTYLLRRAFYDELHDEEDGKVVPLYVRNDRDHEIKDHDIHIKKS